MHNIKVSLLPLMIAMVVAACGGVRTSIDEESTFDRKVSYVYGHFHNLAKDGSVLSIRLDKHDIDLTRAPRKPPRFLIAFETTRNVSLIQVPAGTYDMNSLQIVGDNLFGDSFPNSALFRVPGPITINLKPGGVYYLGDYQGIVTSKCNRSTCRYRWGMKDFKSTFPTSTAKLNVKYGNFANVPKINLFNDIVRQLRAMR